MSNHDAMALAVEAALDDWTDLHCHSGWATDAARAIVADLRGRSGFDGVFDSLNEDTVEDVTDDIDHAVRTARRDHEQAIRGRRVQLVAEIVRLADDRARAYRQHAGELGDKLDAAETELARLRDIFLVMSRRGFGLDQFATDEEQAEYWYRQTERLRGMARAVFGVAP